nr:monocarboxylate transporter 6 like [Tanacetum cinerariifolium]
TELDDNVRKALQFLLLTADGVYILWLFLLPYAPGDPFWAISSETFDSLIGLSLNFFFVLPLMNSVGIHLIDAPVLHPMSEGLFNFVLGWMFMFAPLLFTDRNRDRYKGSLDVLWGFQMFYTNTFLIPYMAIRLNKPDTETNQRKLSQFGSFMVNRASEVGVLGGAACLISVLWALYGRSDGNFGGLAERWEFYPWLIGENLQNVEKTKMNLVKYMRFVPVFGLVAYLLCLDVEEGV